VAAKINKRENESSIMAMAGESYRNAICRPDVAASARYRRAAVGDMAAASVWLKMTSVFWRS
jgi:hypothetical protein